MSILSNIFHKIFPSSHPAVKAEKPAAATSANPSAKPASPATPPAAGGAPNTSGTTQSAGTSGASASQAMPEVDVEQMLNSKTQSAGQTLNWRSSIVDLLKLLDLDSSLQSRKELADELGYQGDKNDSATMNIWLHRQVMNKLAANGGKVPADLKD